MIPAAFRGGRILRCLNIAAVGFALSSVTGLVIGTLLHGMFSDASRMMLGSALPTLVIGAGWAYLLGRKESFRKSGIRKGWVYSLPLAILNGALSCALAGTVRHSGASFSELFFLGGTLGAVVWAPALVATLICFGLPIARAQELAEKGLAGEEKGERMVGAVCVALGMLAMLISTSLDFDPPQYEPFDAWNLHESRSGIFVMQVLAELSMLAGGASVLLSTWRDARRRRFVREVEAQKVPGYRVDDTHEGKVLLRVFTQGVGYRVADFEEEIFQLDEEGEARNAVLGRGSARQGQSQRR